MSTSGAEIHLNLNWAGIAIVFSILGHAFFTIWSAASFKATISGKIDNLVEAMKKMDKEFEKRDQQFSAMWKKVDGLHDRVTKIEIENGIE